MSAGHFCRGNTWPPSTALVDSDKFHVTDESGKQLVFCILLSISVCNVGYTLEQIFFFLGGGTKEKEKIKN